MNAIPWSKTRGMSIVMKNLRRNIIWSVQGIIGAALAVAIVFPILWIVLTSIKPGDDMFRIPVTIIPENPTLTNYFIVFGMSKFLRYFINSLIVTVCSTVFNLVCSLLAAYALDRFVFRGKQLLLGSVMLTQIMPAASTIIPIYRMWSSLRMIDTYPALIITLAMTSMPLTLWMLIAFIHSVPKELDEAAAIDGCTPMMILFRILLPLTKPAIFASAIYVSLNVWQEFMVSMTLVTTERMRTLMFGLYSFVGEKLTNWGPLMAAAVLTTIPVMIFFGATQKQFTHGVTGAVKG